VTSLGSETTLTPNNSTLKNTCKKHVALDRLSRFPQFCNAQMQMQITAIIKNRPDMIIKNKKDKICLLIDVAIP
jgi:hypothetical protein